MYGVVQFEILDFDNFLFFFVRGGGVDYEHIFVMLRTYKRCLIVADYLYFSIRIRGVKIMTGWDLLLLKADT